MDAQSLLNLKMRLLRASRQDRLHDTIEEELVGEINLDDIGHLFATVYSAASVSHDPDSFNLFVEAVSYSKNLIKVRPEFSPQLVQLKAKWQGFDFRLQTNSTNQLTAACWITPRHKERLKEFGDVIFLDFVEGTNAEKFSACLPSCLNDEKRIYRVAYAVTELECGSCSSMNSSHAYLSRNFPQVRTWNSF